MSDDLKQDLRRISKGYRACSVLSEPLLSERDLIELRKVRGKYVWRITPKGRMALRAQKEG